MSEINQWPRPKGIVVASDADVFGLRLPVSAWSFHAVVLRYWLSLLLLLVKATIDLVGGKSGAPALVLAGQAFPVILMWVSAGAIVWFCWETFRRAWRRQLHVTVSRDTFSIGYAGFGSIASYQFSVGMLPICR